MKLDGRAHKHTRLFVCCSVFRQTIVLFIFVFYFVKSIVPRWMFTIWFNNFVYIFFKFILVVCITYIVSLLLACCVTTTNQTEYYFHFNILIVKNDRFRWKFALAKFSVCHFIRANGSQKLISFDIFICLQFKTVENNFLSCQLI